VILENLAKTHSEYFKVALDGAWAEAKSGTFELPEENPAVFGYFVDYMYNKKLRSGDLTEDTELFLIESYLLAERRGSVDYRNTIMDALKSIWIDGKCPTLETILLVFNDSLDRSKLRRFIVDRCAWDISAKEVVSEDTLSEGIVPGFCLGLSVALMKRYGAAEPDYSCASRGQHQEHGCNCGHAFRHLSSDSCNQYNNGVYRHTCSSCGLRIETWRAQNDGTQFSKLSQSPYNKNFCAEYHEHAPGVSCEDGCTQDSHQVELC